MVKKQQCEVIRVFGEPDKDRDEKIIKEVAKEIANYIRRKKRNSYNKT